MEELPTLSFAVCFFTACFTSIGYAKCELVSDVQRLMDDKFSPAVYNPQIRGQLDQTRVTDVNITFLLRFVLKLDDLEETFEVLAVLLIHWNDERLVWNPEDYNGTQVVYTTIDKVWRPEVTLENPATTRRFLGDDLTRMPAKHSYDGLTSWPVAEDLKVVCSVDLRAFPWDVQTCKFIFVVYGYWKNEVRLLPGQDSIDLSMYESNGEWVLLSSRVYQKIHPNKSILVFEMIMKRRPEFFVVNIFLPILALSILNLFVFIVPIDSGERISFSLTLLLSTAVFITLISENLPPSAETMAAICYLLLFVLVQSTLICLCNIISVKAYFKPGEHTPGKFWRKGCINAMIRKTVCRSPRIKAEAGVEDLEERMNNTKQSDEELNETISWRDISSFFDFIFLILMSCLLALAYCMFTFHVVNKWN